MKSGRTSGQRSRALKACLVGATVMAALCGPGDTASAANAPSSDVVVLLKDDVSPAGNAQQHGVQPVALYRTAVAGYSARVTASQQAAITADPAVQMVVPNVRFSALGSQPHPFTGQHRAASASTTYAVEQYAQFVPTEVQRVGADRSRTAAIDGMNNAIDVGVAVLDSGIQLDNPELRVAGGVKRSDEQTNDPSAYGDYYGHGTEGAGVLAAQDNAFGIVGVAPGARLYSVRVLDSTNGGELSNILCGIDWVTAHRGVVRVANLSLAGPGSDDHACGLRNRDALYYAICRAVLRGVTVVAGAGTMPRTRRT